MSSIFHPDRFKDSIDIDEQFKWYVSEFMKRNTKDVHRQAQSCIWRDCIDREILKRLIENNEKKYIS